MFNLEDQKYIKLLDLNAQIYTESEFNCKHIHLDSKSDEKDKHSERSGTENGRTREVREGKEEGFGRGRCRTENTFSNR